MKICTAVLVGVLVSGCGKDAIVATKDPMPDAAKVTDPGDTAGSRLKVRAYVGDDGSKQFLGWRDTKLNLDCTFEALGDGTARCLPALATTSPYFVDAACSTPLAVVAHGCSAPVLVSGSATACGFVGAQFKSVTGPATTCFAGTPATCAQCGDHSAVDLYVVGAPVDVGTYVGATAQVQ